MSDLVNQALSLVGAVVILAAYGAQALKFIESTGRLYLSLNLVGGVLLCLAAIGARQVGFIILEGVWSLFSLIGLLRTLRAG